MPNPLQILSLADFDKVLAGWQPRRRITEVHVHCTDRPRHAEFRGLASIEAMRKYHMSIGMSDIAQHLTIDPQGLLWTGRPFDAVPASVRGHNGSSAAGPFMIEMVGLFDKGADMLHGDQEKSVHSVVCAVLRKFDLGERSVKFHREFPNTGKTCPGSGLDPVEFRAKIKMLLGSNTLSHFDVRMPRLLTRSPLSRNAVTDAVAEVEAGDWQVPESADALAEQMVLAKWLARGERLQDAGSRSAGAEFRELIGHVVNTSQGVLSGKGAMQNTPDDLDVMIEHHLGPAFDSGKFKHIVFYAHGGLVSERSALCYAKLMLPWWTSFGVYPIFFVWESDMISTILKRRRALPAGRGIDDAWDKLVEWPTQLAARKIWADIKTNARRCASAMTDHGVPGGLYEFARRFLPWFSARQGAQDIKLHVIGHSTGPILQARFMPLLMDQGLQFETLSYLAPAIRIDDFRREVEPHVGKTTPVREFTMYTMNQRAEKDDNVARIYRKSLLYYVREACEDEDDGKVMGLQEDLFDDAAMKALFKLGKKSDLNARNPARQFAIEFSQHQDQPPNPKTRSTEHGGFDNDEATMSSVLARILGVADLGKVAGGARFPREEEFDCCRELDDATDASARGDGNDLGGGGRGLVACPCCPGCPCCAAYSSAPKSAFDLGPGEEDTADGGEETADEYGQDPATTPRAGRRRAVCVGIDRYAQSPLAGCVNDSRNWAKKLKSLGFAVQSIENEDATRQTMLTALRELIRNARAGDELVFQYAGHGTQVEDLDGDEGDRFDEALVPVDYDRGELLIDDDIYAETLKVGLVPGAHLTLLMDCCHSGSNVRAAPGPVRPGSEDRRNRFMVLPTEALKAYRRKRSQRRATSTRVEEREPVPGVVSIAACLDREVALESNGQGDFTRHALSVIDGVTGNGGSNQVFLNEVLRAFGANREQNPTMIDPAPGLRKRIFLGGRKP